MYSMIEIKFESSMKLLKLIAACSSNNVEKLDFKLSVQNLYQILKILLDRRKEKFYRMQKQV